MQLSPVPAIRAKQQKPFLSHCAIQMYLCLRVSLLDDIIRIIFSELTKVLESHIRCYATLFASSGCYMFIIICAQTKSPGSHCVTTCGCWKICDVTAKLKEVQERDDEDAVRERAWCRHLREDTQLTSHTLIKLNTLSRL